MKASENKAPHRRNSGRRKSYPWLAADKTQERVTEELIASERRARSKIIDLEVRESERRDQLMVANKQLQVANKELEAFNYSISHGLRAPLRSIAGYSAVLRSSNQGNLDENGKNYLLRIELATRRMSALIDAMMSLSRTTLADLVRDELDLSGLARLIGSQLQEAQPERQVRLSVEPDMEVRGDKVLLEIALRCLLDNAWKFTARNHDASIEVGSEREAVPRVYFVRDNGAGFDQTFAQKMFQPFQRLHVKEEFTGTGIGLSLVQRVIQRHGGRVWAESKPGKGATFFFTLSPEQGRGGSHD